ncbi:rhomboid family intramembrane serine protease [Opitutales bacterium]|nr:rhomboid family intramembrane serine protease [Opitutales bacterium]
MRRVGDFNTEKQALRFWSYLKNQGIESSLEEGEGSQNSGWEIWVAEEDQVSSAFAFFEEFQANPEDQKYISTSQKEKEVKPTHPTGSRGFKQFNLRDKWQRGDRYPGTMTLSLIITCVAVFLLSGMGRNTELMGGFFISEKVNGELSEFLAGEIWRVFTPIFLHFNFLHILFNMYWLHELGSQIERKKGPKFFISFILLIALVSNLVQFILTGPAFGGMSGVVYGLFGYVWVKTRLDPADGFRLDPMVAMIMFGFFLICFTGIFGGIANWAHAGGLAVGLAWGYGSAYRWNHGRK